MQHATSLLARAEPELGDPTSRAEAARIRAEIEIVAGRPGQSYHEIVAAAKAAAPVKRSLAFDLLGLALEGAAMSGYPERMLEVTGIAAGLEPEPGSERQAVGSLLLAGFGRLLSGDPPGAAPMFEEALGRAEALDEPRQVLWAAAGGIFIGDRGRALRARSCDRTCP